MRIRVEAAWVQKEGNKPSENEDASAPEHTTLFEGTTLPVAVADGATESLFSGLWARLLVRAFTHTPFPDADRLLAALPDLQRQWDADVRGKDLPWYAQEKLHEGAFATLLGLSLSEAEGSPGQATWHALAVGDSCLFQVRKEQVLRSFPLERAEAFGSAPFLIATHRARNAGVANQVRTATGELHAGDTLLLMTDALACWFLSEHERGQAPWRALPGPEEEALQEAFQAFVGDLRRRKVIRNDDCTLLRLHLQE